MHIDSDIWFWKQFEKAGKTLCVHPGVRIGHLEMVVGEFDDNMKHQFTRVETWLENQLHEKEGA